jgi:hypothetical protein
VGKLGELEFDLDGQSIDALILGEQGVPSIAASDPATFGESVVWIAVDPNLTTQAFGSLRAGEAKTRVLINVNLASFTTTALPELSILMRVVLPSSDAGRGGERHGDGA